MILSFVLLRGRVHLVIELVLAAIYALIAFFIKATFNPSPIIFFLIIYAALILLLKLFAIGPPRLKEDTLFCGILLVQDYDSLPDRKTHTRIREWSCKILDNKMWGGWYVHGIYNVLKPKLEKIGDDFQLILKKRIKRLDKPQEDIDIEFRVIIKDEKQFINNKFLQKILKWHVIDGQKEEMDINIEKYFESLIKEFLPDELEIINEEDSVHDKLQDAFDSSGFDVHVHAQDAFETIEKMKKNITERANSAASYMRIWEGVQVKLEISWGM